MSESCRITAEPSEGAVELTRLSEPLDCPKTLGLIVRHIQK